MDDIVQCRRCLQVLEKRESQLVHRRWCRARLDIAKMLPPAKRRRQNPVFTTGATTGLGAGAGMRREDAGVVVDAAHDERLPELSSDDRPTGPELLKKGEEWTKAATTEEVMEAIRRTMLTVGAAMGAKTVDRLMDLHRHPSFRVEAYHAGMPSHRQILKHANSQLESSLLSLRYQSAKVTDSVAGKAEAEFRIRDPVEVVKRQIVQLSAGTQDISRFFLKPFKESRPDGEQVFSHPMSTGLAAEVHSRVQIEVGDACAAMVEGVDGWKEGYDVVLMLQLYSDKTTQTLKTTSQKHLPLHVAVLNTSLTMKEKMICQGDCVVGYLPTGIKWESKEAKKWNGELLDVVGDKGSRESKMRILQAALQRSLEPLLSLTIRGFIACDSTGRPFRCHPVLWSYTTDLPEGWDVSSSVCHRCSRCRVEAAHLCDTESWGKKKASRVSEWHDELERATGKHKKAQSDAMWANGMSRVRPYLLSLGDNYGVDLFKCLRYEFMHNIHLGLTKTLLECLSERLRSDSMRSSEFTYKDKRKPNYGEHKTFSTIRTSILRALNDSLELYDRQSSAIAFKVAHRSNEKTTTLNGLFKKQGIASMLEARDMGRILQVMPFLGATCDRLCGEGGKTTALFTNYVELVFMMTRAKSRTEAFSVRDVGELRQAIKVFMGDCQELYGAVKSNDMSFPKMHMLTHVADDILEGGALAHYRADAYEASHKRIKTAYNAGSRRGDRGHAEALDLIARADFFRMGSGTTQSGARIEVVASLTEAEKRTRGAATIAKLDAVKNDSVVLHRSSDPVIPAAVFRKLVATYRLSGGLITNQICSSLSKPVRDLVADLGGVHDFVWFAERLQLKPADTVSRSISATVNGFPLPEAVKSSRNKPMLISVDQDSNGCREREVQRMVAAHSFHSSQYPIQHFVMIEAGEPKATAAQLHPSVKKEYASSLVRSVWIGKLLALLTVKRNETREVGKRPGPSKTEEFALVQYLDICEEEPDAVEDHLKCTKLRWAQSFDEKEKEKRGERWAKKGEPLRYFAVIDAATIRGVVHIVRGDYGLQKSNTHGFQGDRLWTKQWFYLNRFKLQRGGAKLSMSAEEKP